MPHDAVVTQGHEVAQAAHARPEDAPDTDPLSPSPSPQGEIEELALKAADDITLGDIRARTQVAAVVRRALEQVAALVSPGAAHQEKCPIGTGEPSMGSADELRNLRDCDFPRGHAGRHSWQ